MPVSPDTSEPNLMGKQMQRLNNNGNMYVEYIIIFFIVILLCIVSLKAIGGFIAGMIVGHYEQGDKIRITFSGVEIEKVGLYGGTRATPVYYTKKDGKVVLDLGYLNIDNLEPAGPNIEAPANPYGSETLRYYSEVLDKVRWAIATKTPDAPELNILRGMSETTFGIANKIDELSLYNHKNSKLTTPGIKMTLKPSLIQMVTDNEFTVKNFPIYPGKRVTDLQITKEDFDLLCATKSVYIPALRYDTGESIFIWLLKIDRNNDGIPEDYTLQKIPTTYTTLNNVVEIDKNLLNASTDFTKYDDYKTYSLYRIFNTYADNFEKSTQNETIKQIVNIIAAEINNITSGVIVNEGPNESILVVFNPQIPVSISLPQKVMQSFENTKFISENQPAK
jgi:hypothetical protein